MWCRTISLNGIALLYPHSWPGLSCLPLIVLTMRFTNSFSRFVWYYGFGKKAYEQFIENLPKPEELPYLPEEPTEEQKVAVPVAKKEDIKLFTTAVFDSEKAGKNIVGDPLERILGERVFSPEYKANELTRPPLPPKKDILYLCAIAGAGQGLCGNAQEGDLHLQRGVVKTVTDRTIRESENGKGAECVETTRAAITMTVVEADGTIRHLS